MSSYRRRLPPLDTLVFFECALRRGSFTEAATELMVSQAAVSKRIRQLETWLGTPLFDRSAHRLVPTETGRRLGERVAVTLGFLDQSIAEMRAPANPVVQVTSMTAAGMFWLQPRLRVFSLSDAACHFNLHLTDDHSALLSEANDLVVIYGAGEIPGWQAIPLFGEELVPLASAGVAARLAAAGTLADPEAPLLEFERHSPDWIDWAGWADRVGVALPGREVRLPCSSYAQTIGRALAGQGVALGSLPLLRQELESGHLVTLDQPICRTSRRYWLAWPAGRRITPEAERLRDALAPTSPAP